MRLHQKACLIVAHEGIHGLAQRTFRKVFRGKKSPVMGAKTPDYERLIREFNEKALTMGHGDLKQYYWYHTIDLGNGLITPGDWDYRQTLPLFKFPTDMRGMNVLDVGSATGFFAFEFERRGANVVSVELPSIADWDMPPGEDKEITLKEFMAFHQATTIDEVHHFHLDGPFEFCRRILNSKVRRCYSTIYDLSAQKVGVDGFDLIFCSDVLLHTFAPLKALAALAPLCRGALVISQRLADEDNDQPPVMLYTGGETRTADSMTWWLPNWSCLQQMLKRLGFKHVSIVGHLTDVIKSHIVARDHQPVRTIIHARK